MWYSEKTYDTYNPFESTFYECELYDYDSNSITGYPATVRLYDSRDELIYEEEMILQSLAAAAHAEKEKEGA